MQWKDRSTYVGQHAFLSPSKPYWINWDDDKLIFMYKQSLAAAKGTELHELAERLIKLHQNLPKKQLTLNMHVNDAIGYRMKPEQPLVYSNNAFGTTDAIYFDGKTLRIHDLKTGSLKAKMEQLMAYAAFFCLDYGINPKDIKIELRIYQSNDIEICHPPTDAIIFIMAQATRFDRLINQVKEEEG